MSTQDARQLRIAVVGDVDGIHTRAWLRWAITAGHEVHAVSFYPPAHPIDGVQVHVLRHRAAPPAGDGAAATTRPPRLPAGLARLAHALRYRRAGLRNALREIEPDVVHAHFVVEHGFYAAVAGVHPLVVTAWGSDVLVAPGRDRITRLIARWTLARADAITSNNRHMARRMVESLAADEGKMHVITLGADAAFAARWAESVNVGGRPAGDAPVVLSTRAHEPLYNIERIIDAWAGLPSGTARLVIAHAGSGTDALRERATRAAGGGDVTFTGTVDEAALRDLMTNAEVFVSVPSSDGTSVALLQAMSAGCFPVVADLPSQHEWVEDGVNGLLVPLSGGPGPLARAIARALDDAALRRAAAERNRMLVAERGTNEAEMKRMDALYRELAARRVTSD